MPQPTIRLLPLCEENRNAYLHLRVHDSQKTYIETPERSLRDMETHAWQIDWHIECLCLENTVIGYAMHGINALGDVWLDRFMIDRDYQHRGYGTKALTAILPMLKDRYPNRRHILLSVETENAPAIRLYERFGFRMAGYREDNEDVMILTE